MGSRANNSANPEAFNVATVRRFDVFGDLSPEEKVKFSQAEIPATLATLNDAIARRMALRTEVEDPGGLVRYTFGH